MDLIYAPESYLTKAEVMQMGTIINASVFNTPLIIQQSVNKVSKVDLNLDLTHLSDILLQFFPHYYSPGKGL